MAMNMKQMSVPRVELNSGYKMPVIGMGTAPALPPYDQLVSTLIDAIEASYRHFDTAALYGSEEAVGQAVAEALQRGLIKCREQLFITSKLWCTETHRDLVLPALKRTLGQEKMLKFCKEKGIHVSAWSPLGANGIPLWGNHAVMQSPVLKDIATHKHKSVAQVALRWVYEQGASVLVKSFNKDRMKENLQILDWELSNDEISRIQELPLCTGFKVDMLIHPNGPYKSAEQFWDGEL